MCVYVCVCVYMYECVCVYRRDAYTPTLSVVTRAVCVELVMCEGRTDEDCRRTHHVWFTELKAHLRFGSYQCFNSP